jgi:hypothetical protein
MLVQSQGLLALCFGLLAPFLLLKLSVAVKAAGRAKALAHCAPQFFTTWAETTPINSLGCQGCSDVLIRTNAYAQQILA